MNYFLTLLLWSIHCVAKAHVPLPRQLYPSIIDCLIELTTIVGFTSLAEINWHHMQIARSLLLSRKTPNCAAITTYANQSQTILSQMK